MAGLVLRYVSVPALLLCMFGSPSLQASEQTGQSINELVNMSIEDLMQVKVTSVSRKPEALADAASAVFVITQDDIRRSGALSIPEALRFVPGLQVARVDANKWAISARGGNGLFANRLLVLMDGRSLYSPLFSGVWWDVQDTAMDDIDRIEVIRGPGAAMWGANAVNGVINIITKQARETQGVAINVAGGNKENGRVSARLGTKLGTDTFLRFYASHFDRIGFRDDLTDATGADHQNQDRGGFRLDSELQNDQHLTVQGDFYAGQTDGGLYQKPQATFPYRQGVATNGQVNGQNLLGRWTKSLSPSSNFAVQLYWDRTFKLFPYVGLQHEQNTYDVDFQHTFDYGERQHIVWGGGYRLVQSEINNTFVLSFAHPVTGRQIVNFFAQDDITLIPDRLRLTLGSKFEHNDYTGMEPQPSARLSWTPTPAHTLWTSISRAVRIPALVEDNLRGNLAVIDAPIPVFVTALRPGKPGVEQLLAAEVGYRTRWSARFSFDIAGYYHMYNDITYAELGPCGFALTLGSPSVECPLNYKQSTTTSIAYGAEIAADALLFDIWRLRMGYTYQHLDYGLPPGTIIGLSTTPGRPDPTHQFYLRSSIDLPHDVFFDVGLRYVDQLPAFNINHYVTLDARLAWKPRNNLELALVGQNLVEEPHQEFGPQIFFPASLVAPSYFAQARLQF